jgi:hypothetical protein
MLGTSFPVSPGVTQETFLWQYSRLPQNCKGREGFGKLMAFSTVVYTEASIRNGKRPLTDQYIFKHSPLLWMIIFANPVSIQQY